MENQQQLKERVLYMADYIRNSFQSRQDIPSDMEMLRVFEYLLNKGWSEDRFLTANPFEFLVEYQNWILSKYMKD